MTTLKKVQGQSDTSTRGSILLLICSGAEAIALALAHQKLLVILILFCASLPIGAAAMEKGKPPITFYDTHQLGFHNQNWSIKQHSNGLIYTGNGENLLVFDGTTWRGLLADKEVDVKGFTFLHDRIYIGGRDDIGYLEADPSGRWQFHSLKAQYSIPTIHRTLKVIDVDGHVLFLTFKGLWIQRPDGRFERLAQDDFINMWRGKQYILVQSKTRGIRQFDLIANQWQDLAAVNQHIEERQLKAVVPLLHRDGWLLITTDSIYSYPERTHIPLSTAATTWLRQHSMGIGGSSTLLPNGHIALAGRTGGILILNIRGEVQWIIDKHLGFNRRSITSITFDHHGSLWTTHGDRGIAKIEIGAATTNFDSDLGISTAESLARYNGRLFATNYFGLHVLAPSAEAFKPVTKQLLATHAMVVAGDDLLFSDTSGLQKLRFEKSEMKISHINHLEDIGVAFGFSRPMLDGKRVYASTGLGVIRLQQDKKRQDDDPGDERTNAWQVSKLSGFDIYTRFIEPDRWGNLWAGSYGRLYKISALEQWPNARVERVTDISAASGSLISVFQFDGDVLASSAEEIFRIENGVPRSDQKFSELQKQYGGIQNLHKSSAEGTYWVYFASGKLGKLTLAGNKLHFSPMERTTSQPIKYMLEDQGRYLWLAHNAGVSRIELDNRVNAKKFAPRAGLIIDKGGQARLKHHALEAVHSQPVLLSPGSRDLRFYIELPHYSSLDKVQVRSKLEGLQQQWSNWSDDAYFDYTGLGHGHYTWSLEAKYQDGTVLRSPAITLTISPYWYQQTWVQALGLISALFLVIAAIYGLFYWRITVLKRRNRILEIMVGERTKAITAKNEEITALHERKTRFFYYISHEFRTPLTLIMGAHEAILEKPASKLVRRLVKLAHTNSQRLNQLINRLLDQHLAERGQLRLCVEQHSLDGFIQEVVRSFSYECQQRQVTISLVRVENIALWFDREHMISIFYNIISNALKYSRDNGEIRIAVSREKQSAKVTIADNGIGIPKEVLRKVFAPYYRHQNAQQESRGHGLGLAFSKTLVELHGGSISIESDAAGTRVSVYFPLGLEHFKPESLKKSTDTSPTGLELASISYLPDDDSVEAPTQRSATLLVVDDNYELCQFIKLVLQNEFTIAVEHNGLRALDYCKRSPPDLIIADVMMPVMNGIEMTQALKAHQPTAGIPIILLTALADKPSVVKGLDAGADDYISKPFHIGELKQRIARLLYAGGCGPRDGESLLPALSSGTDFKSAITVEINLNGADPNYGVDAMAKNLGLDRHNLYRYVKDYFDQSPTDLLLKTRLVKAKHLIESSSMPVSAVAYECGFNSVSYFNRSFKKHYHLTPTAWRKQEQPAIPS